MKDTGAQLRGYQLRIIQPTGLIIGNTVCEEWTI